MDVDGEGRMRPHLRDRLVFEEPPQKLSIYVVDYLGIDEHYKDINILINEEAYDLKGSYFMIPKESLILPPGLYKIVWGDSEEYIQIHN